MPYMQKILSHTRYEDASEGRSRQAKYQLNQLLYLSIKKRGKNE